MKEKRIRFVSHFNDKLRINFHHLSSFSTYASFKRWRYMQTSRKINKLHWNERNTTTAADIFMKWLSNINLNVIQQLSTLRSFIFLFSLRTLLCHFMNFHKKYIAWFIIFLFFLFLQTLKEKVFYCILMVYSEIQAETLQQWNIEKRM